MDTDYSDEEILEIFKEKVEFVVEGYKVSIYRDGTDSPKFVSDEAPSTDDPGITGEIQYNVSARYDTIYVHTREEIDNAFDRLLETFIEPEDLEKIRNGDTPKSYDTVGMNETISYVVDGYAYITKQLVPYNKILEGDELYKHMLFNQTTIENQYIVKEGDTLESIANENKLNVKELVASNESLVNENTILSPNQVLNVSLIDPVITVKSTNVVVSEVEVPYATEIVNDDSMYDTDEPEVISEGSNGRVVRVYETNHLNGQETSASSLISEKYLSQPKNKIVRKGTKSKVVVPGNGYFSYTSSGVANSSTVVNWGPITQGGRLTSGFGYRWGSFHYGIDIAGIPQGSSTLAAADGIVVFAGWKGAGGNVVQIDHLNGYVTNYLHHNSIDVKAGQRVVRGQRIGGIGRTGDSTGVHVHFEVYRNGLVQNPESVFGEFY